MAVDPGRRMSIPAEKGEPPPEDERVRCHRALYRKEVGLIMSILGDFASTKGTDPFSDRNRACELQEVLEEIDMIWHHCETSTKLVLSESAINVDGALGLLREFVYRIGRGNLYLCNNVFFFLIIHTHNHPKNGLFLQNAT